LKVWAHASCVIARDHSRKNLQKNWKLK